MTEVSICVVTWNDEEFIQKCLECLKQQSFKDFELIIVDNDSVDNTLQLVEKSEINAKIISLKENTGFCGGHNIGIKASAGNYYLPLNADLFLEPNYLSEMLKGIKLKTDENSKIGMVSGKLLRYDPENNKKTNVIDSTGVYFLKNRRSLDRGAEEIDSGQFDKVEYVFGASGAAPLYSREMLEDIKINNQYFLEYFFAYREDVDLAWRAQHRNWKCIYNPEATAYHVRNNTPLKRKKMSENINMHSVKNRLLLIIQNESSKGFWKDGWCFLSYDFMIFIYVLLKERNSLKAFKFIIKEYKEILSIRKTIQSNSLTKSNQDFIKWFGRLESKEVNIFSSKGVSK